MNRFQMHAAEIVTRPPLVSQRWTPASQQRRRRRQEARRSQAEPRRLPIAVNAGNGGGSEQRAVGSSNPASLSWQDLVQQAQQEVAAQQSAGLGNPYPLDKTRQLVETAMFAAMTGLAYTIGNLLKLESYLAYLLPLPIVLSAMRSGPVPALKTLAVAFLLLLILMGPVRATTFLLVYGLLSVTLGISWSLRLPWALSVPLGAVSRIGGYFAYIALSSWVTNENLLVLMISNIYALLDQLSAVLGTTGSPPLLAVIVVLCTLLLVNSLMYVGLAHVLYAVLLRGMGLNLHGTPKFVEKLVGAVPQQ